MDNKKLGKRLDAVEKKLPLELPPLVLSETQMRWWVPILFQSGSLNVGHDGLVVTAWPERYKHDPQSQQRNDVVAKWLNDIRRCEDGTLAMFLPMTPADVDEALRMLCAGRIFVKLRNTTLTYCRIEHSIYPYRKEEYDIAHKLDPALRAYQASGAIIEPFTTETVIEALEVYVAQAEAEPWLPVPYTDDEIAGWRPKQHRGKLKKLSSQ